jgi:acetyltransferase-like isoleucine patch superfamily enzyme
MPLEADRRVPYDWFDGRVPDSVDIDDEAYIESAFSFQECRAQAPHSIRIARGAHLYSATIFDIGERGRVEVGVCSMLNGARLICDERISIGSFATISWNVMFIDSYRVPTDPLLRRELLKRAGHAELLPRDRNATSAPIVIHDNVWIGFDVCVLPGVTIGEGAVVGARSVVVADVPAYFVVAGNPARPIRELERPRPDELPTP